jgi:hypothetical protein
MNTNGKHINHALSVYPRARRLTPVKDEGVMAIHTGLSVTVAGHLIELERDEYNKTAKLVVSVIAGHQVTGLEGSAVNAAAELLARRAQRFLGQNWKIVPLPKIRETPARSA